MTSDTPLLDTLITPANLRQLPESDLEQLSKELRAFLLRSVSRSGGHFAAGLGTVELTIALHYLYDTPHDNLVWDVGHQAYPHKILTGRRDRMHTIRQWQGISPFPKRSESEYDAFGTGHSSTSISAALGMAIGAKLTGSGSKSVAIIGDGGMTAGMAFEALNHAGHLKADLLVILNDNTMAISPNVGALANRFAQILSGKIYRTIKDGSKKVLSKVPAALDIARHAEEHVKGLLTPGILFEQFGFNYIGPIDGHDLTTLLQTLKNIRALEGPQFLHIITKKGKGYALAEADPIKYHGVSAFDPAVGIMPPKQPSPPTYSKIFGEWICDMAAADDRVVAITPAMREGSGLIEFEQRFPDRYFDVGIAEQHAVTLAAGMACNGLKPVVAIYSTFLQRAYDQLIHDVVVQNLPVMFAIDRAGCVGADGPTHNGGYDISFMRCLPNIVIMTPADENECRRMLYTALQIDGAAAVRYPRGIGPGVTVDKNMQALTIGKAQVCTEGHTVAILAFGVVLEFASAVGKEIGATVVNMRFVKPIDEDLILTLAERHDLIVTVEENVIEGGAGEAVNQILLSNGSSVKRLNYGLPNRLIQHGTRDDMLDDVGMNRAGLLAFIRPHIRQVKNSRRVAVDNM